MRKAKLNYSVDVGIALAFVLSALSGIVLLIPFEMLTSVNNGYCDYSEPVAVATAEPATTSQAAGGAGSDAVSQRLGERSLSWTLWPLHR